MIISVASDVNRFRGALDRLGQRELPFASALALNSTARQAQRMVTRELPAIFSAKGRPPTPFTMRAIGTTTARKTNLRAEIFVKRMQARYLMIEETGGIRIGRPGAPVLSPVDIARNLYGNIPRGMIRRLLAEPEAYFLGMVHGIYGLWERTGTAGAGRHVLRQARGLRLLVAFRAEATYRPRFGFQERVRASVDTNFLPALGAGLRRAIATAAHR